MQNCNKDTFTIIYFESHHHLATPEKIAKIAVVLGGNSRQTLSRNIRYYIPVVKCGSLILISMHNKMATPNKLFWLVYKWTLTQMFVEIGPTSPYYAIHMILNYDIQHI